MALNGILWEAENTAVGIRHADHMAPLYPQKFALTSPTSCGLSVGIGRSRTQATECVCVWSNLCQHMDKYNDWYLLKTNSAL
jgi:hypothetical protein